MEKTFPASEMSFSKYSAPNGSDPQQIGQF